MRILRCGNFEKIFHSLNYKEKECLSSVGQNPLIAGEIIGIKFKSSLIDDPTCQSMKSCTISKIEAQAPGFREPITKKLCEFNLRTREILEPLGIRPDDHISKVLVTNEDGTRQRAFLRPAESMVRNLPEMIDNLSNEEYKKIGQAVAQNILRLMKGTGKFEVLFVEPYTYKEQPKGRKPRRKSSRYRGRVPKNTSGELRTASQSSILRRRHGVS